MQAGRLLLRKAWSALLTIGFVLVLNFFLFRVLPGDPARAGIKDPRMTRAAQAAIHARFGLDKPVLNCLASLNPLRRGPCLVSPLQTQFFIYVNNLLHGELGISFHTKIPVGELPANWQAGVAAAPKQQNQSQPKSGHAPSHQAGE